MAIIQGHSIEEQWDLSEQFAGVVETAIHNVIEAYISRTKTLIAAGEEPITMASAWQQQVQGVFTPFLTTVYESGALELAHGALAVSTLPPGIGIPGVSDSYTANFISKLSNQMVNVGDDLWSNIQTELAAGVTAGESIPELADRVRTAGSMTTARATATARTTVVGASNAGSYAQASLIADDTMTKQWLATDDIRTRPDHFHADGQIVSMTGVFTVGGWSLAYPGDPTGPAGEVINCRCTLGYGFNGVPSSVCACDTTDGGMGEILMAAGFLPSVTTAESCVCPVTASFTPPGHVSAVSAVNLSTKQKIFKEFQGPQKISPAYGGAKIHKQLQEVQKLIGLGPEDTDALLDIIDEQYKLGGGKSGATFKQKYEEWLNSAAGKKTTSSIPKFAPDVTAPPVKIPTIPQPTAAVINEATEVLPGAFDADKELSFLFDKFGAKNLHGAFSTVKMALQYQDPTQALASARYTIKQLFDIDFTDTSDEHILQILQKYGDYNSLPTTEIDNALAKLGINTPLTPIEQAIEKLPQHIKDIITSTMKSEIDKGTEVSQAVSNTIAEMTDADIEEYLKVKKQFENASTQNIFKQLYSSSLTTEPVTPVINVTAQAQHLYDLLDEVSKTDLEDLYDIFAKAGGLKVQPSADLGKIFQVVSKNAAKVGEFPEFEALSDIDKLQLMIHQGKQFGEDTTKLEKLLAAKEKVGATGVGQAGAAAGVVAPEFSATEVAVNTFVDKHGFAKLDGLFKNASAFLHFGDKITPDKVKAAMLSIREMALDGFGVDLSGFTDTEYLQMLKEFGTGEGKSLIDIDKALTKLPPDTGVPVSVPVTPTPIITPATVSTPAVIDPLDISHVSDLTTQKLYKIYKASKPVTPNWGGSAIYKNLQTIKATLADDPAFAGLNDGQLLKMLDKAFGTKGTGKSYLNEVSEWLKTPAGKKTSADLGLPTAPITSAPVVTPAAAGTATAETAAAASGDISKITASNKDIIFKKIKANSITLSSPPNNVYDAVQAIKLSPQGKDLNDLQILRILDEQSAAKFGVADSHLYEKKVVEWLKTKPGKDWAKGIRPVNPNAPIKIDLPEIPRNISESTETYSEISVRSATDLQNTYTPWKPGERASLRFYTGNNYTEMNRALRGTDYTTKNYADHIRKAQQGMRPSTQPLMLYRGTGLDALPGLGYGSKLSDVQKFIGKTVQDKGFMSTSVGGKPAFGGKLLIEFEAPTGTPMAFVDHISMHQGENEMLLAAGTKYRVISAGEKNGKIVIRVRIVR